MIDFDNSFAQDMEGFYVSQSGDKAPNPELVKLNVWLVKELGLDLGELSPSGKAELLSGSVMPQGAASISQVYAGHQFGGFSPQLGDGRALLMGEIVDKKRYRYDIQLKGSGPTPFSRGGDGKAVLGPVLREYLMSEAMHALGVPTSRALAAVLTGETVMREKPEKGAVLTRVASSHIRVGTFQYFAARGEMDKVQQLADYTIDRHYPYLKNEKNKYLSFLREVQDQQAQLIAKWVSVGFVHGVMNTDNMTISGQTIDYGPCAFIDTYNPKAVFSSIDEHGRYAYGNQPIIAQWNLARFAETLLPLIDSDNQERGLKAATELLNSFPAIYQVKWSALMNRKLGLIDSASQNIDLINRLHTVMEQEKLDFTNVFRDIATIARGYDAPFMSKIDNKPVMREWLSEWRERAILNDMPLEKLADQMDEVNPLFIPRNHKVEEALEAANEGDMSLFDTLFEYVTDPFQKKRVDKSYTESAPAAFGPHVTYCGT